MSIQATIYRFGPYELRSRTRELYKQGVKLKLRPQPYQVLTVLLERAGDVVMREELRERVWVADTFVNFEHGLNTAIKELRGVLSDSPSEPRYIETLPKLGYRMIVRVEAEASAKAEVAPGESGPPQWLGVERRKRREQLAIVRRRWPVVVGICAVAIAGLGLYANWSRTKVRQKPANDRLMLAVLPFENLTGDPGQEYFSDGLTEEMIAQLGRLDPQHLGVIARTSVMHYKQSPNQLEQVGRELRVQYVLEGSVRRDANTVRVSAQLIQLRDQTHLWSRQYDRELSNLLALQGEIAREIAYEIHVALGDPKSSAPVSQPSLSPQAYEAYDLYLKGRYFWNKRTPAGFQQATEYFQQAITKDPNYARAYAGLADTFALMSTWSQVPQNEFMPKARAAALKALQIDETLAEAHTSLALIAESYDYDWQTAEKEYKRAIQLDPGYATAHQWYAECLSFQGRFDEAFAESERARQLDPLSMIIATDHGAILYFSRQYERAIEQFRNVLEMEPNFVRARMVVYADVQTGQFADALAEVEQARRVGADGPLRWSMLAYVYGRSGQQEQARRALTKLEQLIQHSHSDPTPFLLLTYVGMDRKDEAIALLQKAYSEHSNAVMSLKVEPNYDPLRSDPRFQNLLRHVGLAQ